MSTSQALKTAYFRGVPFIATSHSVSVGRRLASHLFPQRDLGYQEDIGRQDRQFSLEGYLVGDDVDQQRDRLIAAFETAGAGELYHPWLGRLWAVPKPTDLTESRRERRKVTLKLSFIEAEEPRAATPAENRVSLAAGRRAAALSVRQAGWDLLSRIDLRGAPSFAWAGARDGLADLAGLLQATGDLLPVSGIEGFSSMKNARLLISDADRFLGKPENIGSLLSDSLGPMLAASLGVDALGRPRSQSRIDSSRLVREISGFASALNALPMPRQVSYWRRQTIAVQSRLKEGGRLVLLGETAHWLLSDLIDKATSREEAFERVAPILGWSDREKLAAAARRDDDAWSAIGLLEQRIRTSVMMLPNNLKTLHLPQATPSLVVAHRIYGDANRWSEVATSFADPREIRHPGFLTGAGRVPMLQGG
jgi:hypothetical protein